MSARTGVGAAEDEFLAAAVGVMATGGGADALDDLTWWDLLPGLDDDEAAGAVFATLRAQGRRLADTPAVGGLLAQPFLDATDRAPGSCVAAVPRPSPGGGRRWVVLGDVGQRALLFDEPGRGVFVVDADAVARTTIPVAGHLSIAEVEVDLEGRTPALTDDEAAPLRGRSTFLGRLGLAAEILGAAEQVVANATEYAGLREQFGRPIGTFQALRHVLAWGTTDCVAIDAMVRRGVELRHDPPARFDAAVKALAGRNGRRACDRALQAFGGIGFTAEHDHHHFHGRVLVLDALLGTSAELTHELGEWLRISGDDPEYPAAVLSVGVA
ncbi:MAG: acyl-CoA dehydrogenase [Actinomycetota bacterium]|nr:acyl-CoA dehydrogenase [Actinomycetota bacterium]